MKEYKINKSIINVISVVLLCVVFFPGIFSMLKVHLPEWFPYLPIYLITILVWLFTIIMYPAKVKVDQNYVEFIQALSLFSRKVKRGSYEVDERINKYIVTLKDKSVMRKVYLFKQDISSELKKELFN